MDINALKGFEFRTVYRAAKNCCFNGLKGKTQPEIGKTMGTSVQNVSSLIKTAWILTAEPLNCTRERVGKNFWEKLGVSKICLFQVVNGVEIFA